MSWRITGKVKPLTCGISGEQLLPSEKLVLLILADYYNDEQGFAWVSQGRLSKEGLCSVRTLYRLLESLEDVHKIISIEKRKQGETDLYRFNISTITDILSQEKTENVRNSTDNLTSQNIENVRTSTDIAVSTKQYSEPEEQYKAGRVTRGGSNSSEETLPSKEGSTPVESYRIAKHRYQAICHARLGSLNEKYGEQWSSLLEQHGEQALLGAFEIWAKDQQGKKWGYPIAVFMKSIDDYILAYEDESSPKKAAEEDDGTLTWEKIKKEREERARLGLDSPVKRRLQ